MQDLTHPDDWQESVARLTGLAADGIPFIVEKRYVRPDGSLVWVSNNVALTRDREGKPHTFLAVVQDITERKKSETSLRESEARYRSALIAGRMASWETDLVDRTRSWTEEGMTLFGLTLVEGRGHVGGEADEFRAALHPNDRDLVEYFHKQANERDLFEAEYRIVRPDGAILWLSGRGQVIARDSDGKALRLINIVADITDRKKAEEHIQFLLREMTHRSKNLLSVIQGISRQTARRAGTIEEFEIQFRQRLQGLAATHDLLVQRSFHGTLLSDLVRQHLAPFAEAGPRLHLTGPDIIVTTEAAQAVGLALNELATNAVKYGALSVAGGRITISWAFNNLDGEARRLRVSWVERGGPVVTSPTRKGFGHVVIERMVADLLDGEVTLDFAPEGLSWVITIPTTNLLVAGS